MNDMTHNAELKADAAGAAAFEIALGITRGLENTLYHGDRTAVSSSKLKLALISGAHFLAGMEDSESSEALLFGSVLHGYVLEPERFHKDFFAMPKVHRGTKEGKATADVLALTANGKTTFPADWLPTVRRINDNILRHAEARRLIESSEREVAFAWIDKATGIKCKIKADCWASQCNEIADLKSTSSAVAEEFAKSCARYDYPLSAAMYREGVFQVTGERPRWSFIACEKEAPHAVAVYRPTEAFLRRGERDFRRALDYIARWRDLGVYESLQADGKAEYIDLPGWY